MAPLVRLQHIRDETRELTGALAGLDEDASLASCVFRRTAEHAPLIVSEAVRALPTELTSRHPGPRWAGIRGTGNVLRHDRCAVDPRVLWAIQRDPLPSMARTVERMIAEVGG